MRGKNMNQLEWTEKKMSNRSLMSVDFYSNTLNDISTKNTLHCANEKNYIYIYILYSDAVFSLFFSFDSFNFVIS